MHLPCAHCLGKGRSALFEQHRGLLALVVTSRRVCPPLLRRMGVPARHAVGNRPRNSAIQHETRHVETVPPLAPLLPGWLR